MHPKVEEVHVSPPGGRSRTPDPAEEVQQQQLAAVQVKMAETHLKDPEKPSYAVETQIDHKESYVDDNDDIGIKQSADSTEMSHKSIASASPQTPTSKDKCLLRASKDFQNENIQRNLSKLPDSFDKGKEGSRSLKFKESKTSDDSSKEHHEQLNKNKLFKRTITEAQENESALTDAEEEEEELAQEDPESCRLCGKSFIPLDFKLHDQQTARERLPRSIGIVKAFCSCKKNTGPGMVAVDTGRDATSALATSLPARGDAVAAGDRERRARGQPQGVGITEAAVGCHGDDPCHSAGPGGDAGQQGGGGGHQGNGASGGGGPSAPPGGNGGGDGDGEDDRDKNGRVSKDKVEDDEEEKEKNEEPEPEGVLAPMEQEIKQVSLQPTSANQDPTRQLDPETQSESLRLESTPLIATDTPTKAMTRSVSNISGDSGFGATTTECSSAPATYNRTQSIQSPDSGLGGGSPDQDKSIFQPAQTVCPPEQQVQIVNRVSVEIDFTPGSIERPKAAMTKSPVLDTVCEDPAGPSEESLDIAARLDTADMTSIESSLCPDMSLKSTPGQQEVREESSMSVAETGAGGSAAFNLHGPTEDQVSKPSFNLYETCNSIDNRPSLRRPAREQENIDENQELMPTSPTAAMGENITYIGRQPPPSEPGLSCGLDLPESSLLYEGRPNGEASEGAGDPAGPSFLVERDQNKKKVPKARPRGTGGAIPKVIHRPRNTPRQLYLPEALTFDGLGSGPPSPQAPDPEAGQPQQPNDEEEPAMMLPTGADAPRHWNPPDVDQHAEVSGVAYCTILQLLTFTSSIMSRVQFDRRYRHMYGRILEKMRPFLCIVDDCYDWTEQWAELVRLGQGGQGSCHLAQDASTNFKFVFKKIFWKNFRPSELKIMIDLMGHPHCIEPYGILYFDDHFYIIMEYLQGPSLRELINTRVSARSPLSLYEALHILRQILEVLLHLKRVGVLHDDIKAENLVLVSQPNHTPFWIKLIDFGMSKRSAVAESAACEGTRTHWSREKARNEGHSFPADVFSAMMVFVVMLLSYVPREELAVYAVQYKIGEEGAPTDHTALDLPEDVTHMISRGFHDNPELRAEVEELRHHRAIALLERDPGDPLFFQHINPRATLNVMTSSENTRVPVSEFPSMLSEIEEGSDTEGRSSPAEAPSYGRDVSDMEVDEPLLGAVGGLPEAATCGVMLQRTPTEDSDDIWQRYSDIQFFPDTSRLTDRAAINIQPDPSPFYMQFMDDAAPINPPQPDVRGDHDDEAVDDNLLYEGFADLHPDSVFGKK